jgi:hypothetical protein
MLSSIATKTDNAHSFEVEDSNNLLKSNRKSLGSTFIEWSKTKKSQALNKKLNSAEYYTLFRESLSDTGNKETPSLNHNNLMEENNIGEDLKSDGFQQVKKLKQPSVFNQEEQNNEHAGLVADDNTEMKMYDDTASGIVINIDDTFKSLSVYDDDQGDAKFKSRVGKRRSLKTNE